MQRYVVVIVKTETSYESKRGTDGKRRLTPVHAHTCNVYDMDGRRPLFQDIELDEAIEHARNWNACAA